MSGGSGEDEGVDVDARKGWRQEVLARECAALVHRSTSLPLTKPADSALVRDWSGYVRAEPPLHFMYFHYYLLTSSRQQPQS